MPTVLVLYSVALPGGASDASASANDATAGEFVVSTPAALTVGRLRAAWPWPCERGRALLRAQVAPPNESWVWMDLAGDDDSRVPTRAAPEGCGAELVAVVRCVPFDSLEAPPRARAPAPEPEFEMLPEQWERWRTARARAEPEEAYEPFSLARFPLPEEPAGANNLPRFLNGFFSGSSSSGSLASAGQPAAAAVSTPTPAPASGAQTPPVATPPVRPASAEPADVADEEADADDRDIKFGAPAVSEVDLSGAAREAASAAREAARGAFSSARSLAGGLTKFVRGAAKDALAAASQAAAGTKGPESAKRTDGAAKDPFS